MKTYFLLLLPLWRFYFLVHSAPINYELANLDGESALEFQNESKRTNASKVIQADSEDWKELVDKASSQYGLTFPPNSGRGPTVVRVNMKLLAVPLFSEEDFKMTLLLEMTQKWEDKRLSSNKPKIIELPPQWTTEIWQPNPSFEGTLSKIHGAHYIDQSYHIHPNGTVVHTSQLTLSTHCPFFRQKFPFDTRKCELSLGSASYSTKNVIYDWDTCVGYPVKFVADALEFLTGWKFAYFRLYDDVKVSDGGIEFSRVTLQLVAAREAVHVIVSFIIPLGVLVVLNMIPTYIIDNWAARIISGVGMLATTTGMILQRPTGSIDYSTAFDYFCYTGFLLASSCLAQSGIVLCLRRREQSEAEDTREAIVERSSGGNGVCTSLRQRILKCLPCFQRWNPQEIELELDLEAAVPDRELSPAVRQGNMGSERNSRKWDKIFHICTPISTIIALASYGMFNIFQGRSYTTPDETLIDTRLAIFNSTQGLIRRSHYA